jgi:hypothetical protein
MLGRGHHRVDEREAVAATDDLALPRASLHYRLKAWRTFQRALDPLAPPKPLRPPGKEH